jgi:DNA helicase-2/ATP-dependent DNA helicase PcrA
MVQAPKNPADTILEGLTRDFQRPAVRSDARRLLVIAGAGSGKTEIMSRRVVWWNAVEGVPKENIVAFTFTDAAAEELKFRIRADIERTTPEGEDLTLGGMYVGTIHGFCLKLLREWAPESYYNYDIIDDAGRIALVQRGYHNLLGLSAFQTALNARQFETIARFLRAYDLLNEYDEMDVQLINEIPPADVAREREWVTQAVLSSDVGDSEEARTFAVSAARFYAYMRARRLLDFSTSQTELTRLLRSNPVLLNNIRASWTHIVVDEVQDINPVQNNLIRLLVGDEGRLTAVGDHRQAIYAWRGGRVDIMEELHAELQAATDGEVRELPSNFRSTNRVIQISNTWSQTINPLGTLPNPEMIWGNQRRVDYTGDHIALHHFDSRDTEARWIANTIRKMVIPNDDIGARHDDRDGDRGISYSDVAILIRSSTDVRTYQDALRRAGIPSVVRAGPDLFSQPEVLLFLALLAEMSGVDQFYGSPIRPTSLPRRVEDVLKCRPTPAEMIPAACLILSDNGLPILPEAAGRLRSLAQAIHHRIQEGGLIPFDVSDFHCREAMEWVNRQGQPRRVFPQQFYHWMLDEAGVYQWDELGADGQSAMFHLGQLSQLITSIETPGWTTASDLRYQIIALAMWGASNARTVEAPLLVPPDAVTVTTVHSAKGLQFATVFLADVKARRFPSGYARTRESLPFSGQMESRIDPIHLSDNDNYDNERRLMYVALTRAERYLYISYSGHQTSRFINDLSRIARNQEIPSWHENLEAPAEYEVIQRRISAEERLATSFSDLRYFLECPHDFYLRKVLGFAPTIDQAFGYGRGIHNILREIHQNPRRWAELAKDSNALGEELRRLVESGLFYLRYTTGEPLGNMRATALRGLTEYVTSYADELSRLEFEPEREFETLIRDEGLLVSGTIDVIRLDDPPRITIIDFKSGERGETTQSGLSENMMRLQIGIYGLAARHELEYEPDRGLIRYVGEHNPDRRQLSVQLGQEELTAARQVVINAGRCIKERLFSEGPTETASNRCATCDHRAVCGLCQR